MRFGCLLSLVLVVASGARILEATGDPLHRARGQAYRAGTPSVRSGICHHCAMSTCRVIAP